jgi:hypothetical protein
VITQVVERRYLVRVMDILEQAATVLALGDPAKQVELQLVLWILIRKDPELEYRLLYMDPHNMCPLDPDPVFEYGSGSCYLKARVNGQNFL